MSAFAFVHRANVHICFYDSEQHRQPCLAQASRDKVVSDATDTEGNGDDLGITARDDDVACVPWDKGVIARFCVSVQTIADQLPTWDVPTDVFPVEDVHAWVELFSFLEEDANAVSARLLRTLCVHPAQFFIHAVKVCRPYGYSPRKHALSSFESCLHFVDAIARLQPSLEGMRDARGLSSRATALAQRLGWRESGLVEYLPQLNRMPNGMREKVSNYDLSDYLPSEKSNLLDDGCSDVKKKLVRQEKDCARAQWVHELLSPFCDVIGINRSAAQGEANASEDGSEQRKLWRDGDGDVGMLRNSDIPEGMRGNEDNSTQTELSCDRSTGAGLSPGLSGYSDIPGNTKENEDNSKREELSRDGDAGVDPSTGFSRNSDISGRPREKEDDSERRKLWLDADANIEISGGAGRNSDIPGRLREEEDAVTSVRYLSGDGRVLNGRTDEDIIKDRDNLDGRMEKDGYSGTCSRKVAMQAIMMEQVNRHADWPTVGAVGWIEGNLECTELGSEKDHARKEHRAIDGPPAKSDLTSRSLRPDSDSQNTDVPFPIPPEFDDESTGLLTEHGFSPFPSYGQDSPFPQPRSPILPYKETSHREACLKNQVSQGSRAPQQINRSKPLRLQATPCRSAPRLQWSIRGFLAELEQEPLPQKTTVDEHRSSASDTHDTAASLCGSPAVHRRNDESGVHIANEDNMSSTLMFGSPTTLSSATSMKGTSLHSKALQLEAISRDNARELSNGWNNAQARAATRRARLRANLYLQREKMSAKERQENDLHKRFAHRNERRIREFMARVKED